jgi:hypothetical protein
MHVTVEDNVHLCLKQEGLVHLPHAVQDFVGASAGHNRQTNTQKSVSDCTAHCTASPVAICIQQHNAVILRPGLTISIGHVHNKCTVGSRTDTVPRVLTHQSCTMARGS